MKAIGLDAARERLRRARDALERLEQTTTNKERETAWSDFLLASHAVYSKLEQGSKGCGKSQAWFGRKKHERKNDELLRYIHHARNTDDHGITGTTLAGVEIRVLEGTIYNVKPVIQDREVGFVTTGSIGSKTEMTQYLALKMVRDDRYGDNFMPPRTHLGKPIRPDDDVKALVRALDVARLGYAYLEALIGEAGTLPVHV